MVTPSYYPIVGGIERSIETVSIELNKMGVETDILTFNFNWHVKCPREERRKESGLKVIRVPVFNYLPWRLHLEDITLKINLIPRKFKEYVEACDVVHFHNDTDLSFPFFTGLVKKPKIFHVHCLNLTYNFFNRNPVARGILKRIASKYIVVSKPSMDMLEKLGVPKTKITIVPNGVDVNRFVPSHELKEEKLLLFAGRIDPAKGLPVLFESLNYLKTPCRLLIVGPYKNILYHQKIKTLVDKVNAKQRHSVILADVQPPDQMVELYQKATIFVLPSFSESFPMTTLEALACETPVVATNVGGIPTIVQSYRNGLLVPPNDPKKLAESIQYLLDNEKIRREFGSKGRKFVAQSFSSRQMAEKLVDIYRQMILQNKYF